MKNLMRKPIAIILAILIAAGGTGIGVYAVAENNARQQAVSDNVVKEEKQEDNKSEVNVKDETVYILSEADGSVRKIIVSDWLKNALGSTMLNDSSELGGIVNVNGDEGFTSGENGSKTWDAQGNDIYYTGEINKELPVTLSVRYFLDGRELSPEEMKGKSGRVVIRFEYTNNQYETVTIDGKEEKIYVPFAVLTGAMLDNDTFRNVEVSNGKIINDGDRTVIVGIALPGMQSNLNIDSDKLEIPDYFEITADVKAFEMSETVTVATNEIFNNIELEGIGSLDELDEALAKLTDAVDQLSDGSDKLYDGLNTLLEKSSELTQGIDKLVEGAEALKNGTSDLAGGSAQISEGAGQLADGSKQISDGSKELSNGLDLLSQNSAELNAGSKQVFEVLLSTASAQIKEAGLSIPDLTIDNYHKVLEQTLSSLDEASVYALAKETAEKKVAEAVKARENEITAAVTQAVKAEVSPKVETAVRANVEAQVLASQGLTKEQYEAAIKSGAVSKEKQAQITAAVNSQMKSDSVKTLIAQNIEAQMQSAEIKKLIAQKVLEQEKLLIDQNLNSDEVKAQINEAAERARASRESIKALIGQLDSYNEFYTGLKQYTAGVDQAAQGASQLKEGAESLNNGANALDSGANGLKTGADTLNDGAAQLYEGLITLKNSAPALIDGITQLRDGAKELSDGMKEFKEQGIQKLADAVDGDLSGLLDRLQATADVSRGYNSFSGISSGMEGNVKFVYRTDSIK